METRRHMGVQVPVIPAPLCPKSSDTYAFTQGQTGVGMARVVKTSPVRPIFAASLPKARAAIVWYERIYVRRPRSG